jgi:MFS family permease
MARAGTSTKPASWSPESRPTTYDMSWQQLVAAVATAAGGAAWVSAVGSGVVALRLRQADLPIEPVVALMSAEHRFAVGAGILIVPLLAGFIGFLADWKLGKNWSPRARKAWAPVTVLVGTALVGFLLKPPFKTLLIEYAAVSVTVPVAFHFLADDTKRHGFHERLVVFLSVLAAAGAGAVLAESFGSPSFDETEITIRDHAMPVTGGYITSTEHSVVLSPACEVIEAVPRDQIARIRVGPGEVTRTQC